MSAMRTLLGLRRFLLRQCADTSLPAGNVYARMEARFFASQNAVRNVRSVRSPIEASALGDLMLTPKSRSFSLLVRDTTALCVAVPEIFSAQKRFKKKAAAKASEELDEDEEANDEVVDEEDDGIPKDHTVRKVSVYNPRADTILKSALGSSRSKVEELFYEGRWRVNGEKVTKKAIELATGDEVDVVIGNNEKNPDFLDVQRVVVEDIGTAVVKSKIIVTLKIWKKLAIENYKPPHKFSITGN